jgi:hypothetical protein
MVAVGVWFTSYSFNRPLSLHINLDSLITRQLSKFEAATCWATSVMLFDLVFSIIYSNKDRGIRVGRSRWEPMYWTWLLFIVQKCRCIFNEWGGILTRRKDREIILQNSITLFVKTLFTTRGLRLTRRERDRLECFWKRGLIIYEIRIAYSLIKIWKFLTFKLNLLNRLSFILLSNFRNG